MDWYASPSNTYHVFNASSIYRREDFNSKRQMNILKQMRVMCVETIFSLQFLIHG